MCKMPKATQIAATIRLHCTTLHYAENQCVISKDSKYTYVSGVSSLSCASVRVLPESQYAKNSAKYSRLLW